VSPQFLEKVLFNKLLPRCSKLNEKHAHNKLEMAFKKWKKQKEKDDVKKLQFKVLHKMKNQKVSDLLRKKYLQWKNNKPLNSKVYPNTTRATSKLQDIMKKNQTPELIQKMKRLSELKKKDKLLSKLLVNKIEQENTVLRVFFIKWWKCQIKAEKIVLKSTCRDLKMRNIKKFILLNKPLSKFFKRWVKNMIEIKKDGHIKTKDV
jgi:hypothetical protein